MPKVETGSPSTGLQLDMQQESNTPTGSNEPDPTSQPRGERVRPIEYALVALIAGTLGVMAVPSHTPKLMEIEGMAQLMQLEQKLEIYRMVMETYREEHRVYPGYGYGQKGSWLHGQPSGSDFTRQLIYCSTEWGRTSSSDPLSYPYGPYLYSGLPKNPINGLDTVRILTDDQTFPAEPDSLTGWIYKPATGEIHANSIGDSIVSGIPFYQL